MAFPADTAVSGWVFSYRIDPEHVLGEPYGVTCGSSGFGDNRILSITFDQIYGDLQFVPIELRGHMVPVIPAPAYIAIRPGSP